MIARIVVLVAVFAVACQGARISQIKKMISKSATSAVLSLSLATSSMLPTQVMAAEASKLFAEAEQAIQMTQKEYKNVEDSWATTKRTIGETSKNFGKASELIKDLQTDFVDLESNVAKFNAATESTIAAIEAEISRLQVSTGTKFNAAQDARNSEKPPSVSTIARLYKEAEREANLLAKELENVKSFKDILASSNLILADKTKAVDQDLAVFATRAEEVQTQHSNGLALLVEGLNKNINACHYGGPQCVAKDQNGLFLFRQGYDQITLSQDSFKKVSKDLDKDYKDVQFIETQLTKVSTQLHDLLTSLDTWEKDTTLKTKVGKNALKSASEVFDRALVSAQTTSSHFLAADDKLLRKNDKKASETDELEKDLVRGVLAKLENAERDGKRTESLMRAAKVQGDKEASMYLQYVPKSVDGALTATGGKK